METPLSKIKILHPLMPLSSLRHLLHVHDVSSSLFNFYLDIERYNVPAYGNCSILPLTHPYGNEVS
jgi:hypothetical protein